MLQVTTALQSASTSTQNVTLPSASESTKWSHRRTTTPSSLPHKRLAVAPPKVPFSSPDRSDLKEALRSGGSTTNFNVTQGEFASVICYPVVVTVRLPPLFISLLTLCITSQSPVVAIAR
jgi:hypothetical protein